MLEKIRAQWTKVIHPFALGLLKLGVTPDMVTWTGTIATIIVALVTMWVGYRVALRAGRRPTLHGLVLGLMVAISGLVFSYLTAPISSVDLAAFFLLLLGGTIGGRSAQRVLTRSAV